MSKLFALFSRFELFRVPSSADYEPPGPEIPTNALITQDGVPLVTADGQFLLTEN